MIIDKKNLKQELDEIWSALSKYSVEILDILKQDQELENNNNKILIEIRKDKNRINTKKAEILLSINLALTKYKMQRAK